MDDFTLGKKLFGKEATTEQKTFAANPSTASIVEMIAVTASSGGEVVVRNADEDSDDIWENGEPGVDFIELGEDGDYDEEAYDNVDDLEDVDDGALDMTDGDGADIEGSDIESVAFTVEAYHEAAVAAAEEEAGQEDDALAGEEDYVTDDLDDGDASEVEDPGDPSLDDPVPGEDAEAVDMTDDEFTAVDDNDPDESEEPLEDVEISDGSTVVETTVSVKEGDRVLVSIQDGRMTVIGVVGGGDEANAQTELAQETADEANAAALEAAQDAADATQAASNAQAKAEEADAAASAAQTAANNAQEAANQAATEAGEALQKANDAQAKADLVETNMAGVSAEVDDIKADAAQMRQDMLTSGDIETVKTELSATYATKTELGTAETTLKKYTDDSVAQARTTFEQTYAKQSDVDGAIVEAKADLQTQITQNASEISSVAKSVEAVEVDVTENATKIQEAQSAAASAQSTADQAKTDASQAATAAATAQAAANTAKSNADTAQAAADAAAAELATAKAKLAEVEGNANATAEDLAAAQKAVEDAQKAADDAAEDAANAKAAADAAQGTANTAKENAAKAQTAADNAQKAADEAKEDLKALETRVTTAETAITQNSEQIALRATKTELQGVSDNLASNYYNKTQTDAQIKVSADGIKSTVSAVESKIDNLEVGGRNLLLNTGEGSTDRIVVKDGNVSTGSVASWTNRDGVLTLNFSTSANECFYRFMNPSESTNSLYAFEAGKEYTFSGKAKLTTSAGTLEKLAARSQYYVPGRLWSGGYNHDILAEDAEDWVPFEVTQAVPEDATGCYFSVQVYFTGSWKGTVQLTDLKIERGNRKTDWTPAPEDIEARVSSAESSITQLSDRITANVEATDALGTRMSTVEQTADGLNVRLTAAENDVDNAQNTANTARTEAADAAKTATNYLDFSSEGLVVGDMTKDALGNNVLIDSDSVDIRNGEKRLASFQADSIHLGENAEDAVIYMCGRIGEIKVEDSAYSDDETVTKDAMTIGSDIVGVKGKSEAVIWSSYEGRTDKADPLTGYGRYAYVEVQSNPAVVGRDACLIRLSADYKTVNTDNFGSGIASTWFDHQLSELNITPSEIYGLTDNLQLTSRYGTKLDVVSGSLELDANQVNINSANTIEANAPFRMQALSVIPSANMTLSTSGAKVTMAGTAQKSGDLLSLSNGGIKCSKVGKVLVAGTAYATGMTAGNALLAFFVKGTTEYAVSAAQTGTRTYVACPLQTRVIEVSAGDVIYLYAKNENSATGTVNADARSHLTVMYVG